MVVKKKTSSSIELIVINWKKSEFKKLITTYGIAPEWEPEHLVAGSMADKPPSCKMVVYAEYFSTGNLRFPITKFLGKVITGHCIHLSHIHPFCLMRICHFEFVYRANNIVPTVDKFAIFYKMHGRGAWFNCSTVSKIIIGIEPSRSDYE